ncbi:hypothetical protein CC79DRAFT_1337535 [Sarocladium strictum]
MTRDDDARVAADARHTTPGDESGRESVIPIELRDLKQNEDVKDAEAEEKKASSGLPVCLFSMTGAMLLGNVIASDD